MLSGIEVRDLFFKYFENRNHKRVRSSPLIPIDDPTILFTNAGMNQFKDYFLGNETPAYKTAVTCQKVMRAGGKHNDLDNVGKTPRHHTFFEMLGNFSFGDYFKEEAIELAWNFLTKELQIPKEKLAISVYKDDSFSYDFWKNTIGVPEDRIAKLDEKDNFWSMGDIGPCGPCSEIHYESFVTPNETAIESLEKDNGRFLEIWNLVFMEFDRNKEGDLNPLPKPCIDTGMGLERITSVLQNAASNYDTDIFQSLIKHIEILSGKKYGVDQEFDIASKVISDHLRALIFLINESVLPSNEGRGYVLRRLIRRAARYGHQVGLNTGFLADLITPFTQTIAQFYPELNDTLDFSEKLLRKEEQRFSSTLSQGMNILESLAENSKSKNITGKDIFKLYDTYGFPLDLAKDYLEEKGFSYDEDEFSREMEEQKERARSHQNSGKKDLKIHSTYTNLLSENGKTDFVGYEKHEIKTQIISIIEKDQNISILKEGQEIGVLLKQTPFYPEGGGQVGDHGSISNDSFEIKITNTKYAAPALNIAYGVVTKIFGGNSFELTPFLNVRAKIDENRRNATELNHTATHLLQAALRELLGEHVKQSGSLVTPTKLRFDFTHYEPLNFEQLQEIENYINQNVLKNEAIKYEVIDFDQAQERGAIAFFGEKYGDEVRILTAGSSSVELCGGCHTSRTGNIGTFHIMQETSVASGIRRIEAVTGEVSNQYIQSQFSKSHQIASHLKTNTDQVFEKIIKLEEDLRQKTDQLSSFLKASQSNISDDILSKRETTNNLNYAIQKVEKELNLKELSSKLQKAENSLFLLFQDKGEGKISASIALTNDLSEKYHAGKLISQIAPLFDGKGGGKNSFAQCGGSKIPSIPEIKEKLLSIIL